MRVPNCASILKDWSHQTFISCFLHILRARKQISSQESKSSIGLGTHISSSSNSFPPLNAQASNFDQGHHLYKLWSACHPCVMLSFKIIGYLVLEKLFEGFYYEHGGHLGQVTKTIYTNTFVLPSYGCSTWNLAFIGQVVSEEKIFLNK